MVKFTNKEKAFIKKRAECRVATVSKKHWPQVSTVVHVFDDKNFYFSTDYTTLKYKNLKSNPKIAVAIDVYDRQPKALFMQGKAIILEKGKEFKYAYRLLVKRHAYYRANPFKEGEAPIIKINFLNKSSQGIN